MRRARLPMEAATGPIRHGCQGQCSRGPALPAPPKATVNGVSTRLSTAPAANSQPIRARSDGHKTAATAPAVPAAPARWPHGPKEGALPASRRDASRSRSWPMTMTVAPASSGRSNTPTSAATRRRPGTAWGRSQHSPLGLEETYCCSMAMMTRLRCVSPAHLRAWPSGFHGAVCSGYRRARVARKSVW